MNSQTRREIRFGLASLVLTGIMFILSVVIRGPLDRNPVSLMRAALSPNFPAGVLIGLIGLLFSIYGQFGLYRYLTCQRESLVAFLAFLCMIPGLGLLLPLIAFLAVNLPAIATLYQQGNQAVIPLVESNFSGLGLALLSISSVASIINTILFSVVIWQHKTLPRWLGPVYALKGLLLVISGPGLYTTELLGAVLTLVCAGVLAWKGWQETAVREGQLYPVQA